MNWSYRMKQAFSTFKRMVLPLYAWYIILAVLGLILVMVNFIPLFMSLIQNGTMDVPGIPKAPLSPFSGPYPNPNPPVPPGNGYGAGPGNFVDNLTPFLNHAPQFIFMFLGLILLGWFLSSAFLTGLFHLTKKAYYGPAKFKDFHLKGISRVLGWYGIFTLLAIVFIGIGAGIAFSLRENYALLPVFAGVYTLFVVAVSLFFAPWFSTGIFHMLNHRELSFGRSLRSSWSFYRRHMGSFWAYFLTIIAIQILMVIINQNSQTLGWLLSLLVSPFTAILPIVWVLSHEDEENPPNEGEIPYSSALTRMSEPSSSFDANISSNHNEIKSEDNSTPSPTEEIPIPNITTDEILPQPAPPIDPPQSQSIQKEYDNEQKGFDYPPQDHLPLYTPQDNSEENEQPNFCPTCGKRVRSGASYCSQCGTKL